MNGSDLVLNPAPKPTEQLQNWSNTLDLISNYFLSTYPDIHSLYRNKKYHRLNHNLWFNISIFINWTIVYQLWLWLWLYNSLPAY